MLLAFAGSSTAAVYRLHLTLQQLAGPPKATPPKAKDDPTRHKVCGEGVSLVGLLCRSTGGRPGCCCLPRLPAAQELQRAVDSPVHMHAAAGAAGAATQSLACCAAPPPDAAAQVVFVLGGPGSGKGTQSARLVEEFGVAHLRWVGGRAQQGFQLC